MKIGKNLKALIKFVSEIVLKKTVQNYKNVLFLFGDNSIRKGLGGQAKEMRYEENCIGIVTKKFPSNKPGSFLSDNEYENNIKIIDLDFEKIYTILNSKKYKLIIVPPIGIGMAKLPQKAPKTWKYLQKKFKELKNYIMINEIYTLEKFEASNGNFSIFLAGPTPRDAKAQSWRPDFIKTFKDLYDDNNERKIDIIIPEYKIGFEKDYQFDPQTEWEVNCMDKCNLIVFWIPREIQHMPAFTTNIEFGERMHSGKIIVGWPPNAQKIEYIEKRCKMHNIPNYNNMSELCENIIDKLYIKELKHNASKLSE